MSNMSSKVPLVIFLKTPIGKVEMQHTAKGIAKINLSKESNENPEIISKDLTNHKVEIIEHTGGVITSEAENSIQWIKHFFDPEIIPNHEPTIDSSVLEKDDFTGLVLRTLKSEIKAGMTVTYSGLAELCGSPKACRAVGQAMRLNPIPLLVPCHRVIAKNKGLGHYMSGKGDNIKAWLLEHEKQTVSSM